MILCAFKYCIMIGRENDEIDTQIIMLSFCKRFLRCTCDKIDDENYNQIIADNSY